MINSSVFERSLLSLPGIASFQVLVNGQRGAMGEHFSFRHIAIVENGRVASRESILNDDTLSLPNFSEGAIFVNGRELSGLLFTVEGASYPTHIPFLWDIFAIFGLESMSAGGQVAIFRDGVRLAEYGMTQYLQEFDVYGVRAGDAFAIFDMLNGGAFVAEYLPITLFEEMGFEAYFADGAVHIYEAQAADAHHPHDTNPFAEALLQYFAGTALAEGNTKAFLANITGSNRPGVVATREFAEHFSEARIFYFIDGQVIYKDIPHINGFPYSLAVNAHGRLVMPAGDGGHNTWGLFGVAGSGGTYFLVYDFTIYRAMVDHENADHYFSLRGRDEGFEDGGFEFITEEEFSDIFQRYGLDNLILWWELEDETEQILGF